MIYKGNEVKSTTAEYKTLRSRWQKYKKELSELNCKDDLLRSEIDLDFHSFIKKYRKLTIKDLNEKINWFKNYCNACSTLEKMKLKYNLEI